MDTIVYLAKLLPRTQVWGPFLIMVGAYLLFALSLSDLGEPTMLNIVRMTFSGVLILAGIAMMFMQLRSDVTAVMADTPGTAASQPEYTVAQLSKNYELLRRQTTQGFILSGVFMALGLLVILSGSAGSIFGFTKEGSNLTSVAGVIMEFISGTSLFVYRLNFKRLNETTDKLDGAWRILTAHKLSESLPEATRSEATMKLIEALLKAAPRELPEAANSVLQRTNSATH